ncbi:hypothetical protein Q2941_50465, partial [Bradyrhizobium sp. UFLA05-153]
VRYSFIVVDLHHLLLAGLPAHLCENAETHGGDRRSYASKTVLALKLESTLNLKGELKNVVLAALRSFAFLHSQGQNAKNSV